MRCLWDALCAAKQGVGFESVTHGDNVFRGLVLARIIEATSRLDAGRGWQKSASRRRRVPPSRAGLGVDVDAGVISAMPRGRF